MAEREELLQRFASDLEGIPGDVLAAAEADDIERASVRLAAYLVDTGNVTILRPVGTGCSTKRMLDIAGSSVTQDDGTVQIRVNTFHCLDQPAGEGLRYENPVSLDATARSAGTPCFVTAETQRLATENPEDILISLFSWDAGGSPLGR
jgi:hypothetical protein